MPNASLMGGREDGAAAIPPEGGEGRQVTA